MDILKIDTRKKHKIFYDPLRQSILKGIRILAKPVTAKDLSRHLGIPHSKIYYHMQKLFEIGAIRLYYEKIINGIVAKYYVLDFIDVTIIASEGEYLEMDVLMDETLAIMKKDIDENNTDMIKAYLELKRRHDSNDKMFGIHFYHEDIYLSFKERMELQVLIRDYVEKHIKKPDDLKETTKTRIHFQMYDLEVHE